MRKYKQRKLSKSRRRARDAKAQYQNILERDCHSGKINLDQNEDYEQKRPFTFGEWYFRGLFVCKNCRKGQYKKGQYVPDEDNFCPCHLDFYTFKDGNSLNNKVQAEGQHGRIFELMLGYSKKIFGSDAYSKIAQCLVSIHWLGNLSHETLTPKYEKSVSLRLFKERIVNGENETLKCSKWRVYSDAYKFQEQVLDYRRLKQNVFLILLARKFKRTDLSILPKEVVSIITDMILADIKLLLPAIKWWWHDLNIIDLLKI